MRNLYHVVFIIARTLQDEWFSSFVNCFKETAPMMSRNVFGLGHPHSDFTFGLRINN